MIADLKFDLGRLPRLAALARLRDALPKAPPLGGPATGALPPAMRDMLDRLAALKPGAGLCEMGPRGPLGDAAVPVPDPVLQRQRRTERLASLAAVTA